VNDEQRKRIEQALQLALSGTSTLQELLDISAPSNPVVITDTLVDAEDDLHRASEMLDRILLTWGAV
jgi:hypothetical protein